MAIRSSGYWKWFVALGAIFVPGVALGALTLPFTFTAGTPIRAADVNANFAAVRTEVNANESDIIALQARVTALESAVAKKLDAPTTSGKFAVVTCWSDPAGVAPVACDNIADFPFNNAGGAPVITTADTTATVVTFPGFSSIKHVVVSAHRYNAPISDDQVAACAANINEQTPANSVYVQCAGMSEPTTGGGQTSLAQRKHPFTLLVWGD